MKITLKQLEIFDAVATSGSATRAAEKLGMSQSAVSSALTDLQIILGRPLFVRTRGRLKITEEGDRLRVSARSILAEADEFEAGADSLSGRLRIGASAMIAETTLPDICLGFIQRYPGVRIDIDTAPAIELWQSLANFELETAVIDYWPDLPNIDLTPWHKDELWLIAAPSHPLASRENLTMRDLIGADWCTQEPGGSVTSRVRMILHEEVGQFNVVFSANSNSAVRLATISGGGIACLSRSLIQDDIVTGRLVRLDVENFVFTRTLSLARPRKMWRSRLVRAFDRFLLLNGNLAADPAMVADHGLVR